MRKVLSLFFFLISCSLFTAAQQGVASPDGSVVKRNRIVVFTPLYLDSAFNGTNYKLGKEFIPKYILPGLEFYNGAMLAVDSLKKDSIVVDFVIVDTKQPQQQWEALLKGDSLNNADLFIAAINNPVELKQLADAALNKKIPLISATYPRTTGINNNAYFYLVNSSLKTHLDGVYKHLQQNYAWANMILFTRKTAGGNYVKNSLESNNKSTPAVPLKYKTVEVQDNFLPEDIGLQLDSTKTNVIIAGDIDENFGVKLVQALSKNKKSRIVVLGMPTWESVADFNKESCKGIEIIYSTPYNFIENKSLSLFTQQVYRVKHASRPSDMAFKGYEMVYHFTRLLHKHQTAFVQNINAADGKLFGDYLFTPVSTNTSSTTIDYYENKKLYFIKKIDGAIKGVF